MNLPIKWHNFLHWYPRYPQNERLRNGLIWRNQSSSYHPSIIHLSSINHPSIIHQSSINHPSIINQSSINRPLITLSNSPKGKLLLPKGKLQPPQRGISPSTLAESHLASRRAPPRLSERSASTHRESQQHQSALNPLSKLVACLDQPQKLRSARLTRWVCQVFTSLRFPFCGCTRVRYLVIRSRIHLEPKRR